MVHLADPDDDSRPSERERDAERKRQSRQSAKLVLVPACADFRRRRRLERDISAWLRHYLSDTFTQPFTDLQRAMVAAILAAAQHGGDQAIAAPRGEGKTTIVEAVVLYCVLTGRLRFPVICAATASDAERILSNIKEHVEENERLAADYPEICVPVRALESSPARAHGQVIAGVGLSQTAAGNIKAGETFGPLVNHFVWSGNQVRCPRVPGAPSGRAIIATRGLDAAIRGAKFGKQRPDLALLDDPDTESSASSEIQAGKLEQRIDRAIGGLAGQDRRLSRVMLTTISSRMSVSYKYTDPTQKPSWQGRRYQLLVKKPDREDLWDEYLSLRKSAQMEGDRFGRLAHRFYVERREAMDAGAVVANPNRYVRDKLPDGSPMQVSAVQYCYDLIADLGWSAFSTEYQNDPPEETGIIESALTASHIQHRCNGYPRKTVPAECTVISQGIDCKKVALHWVVRAWRPGATGYVIDKGVQDVHGTIRGVDQGVPEAIVQALRARHEQVQEHPYLREDGTPVPIDLTLVDAGWQTDAIYAFCQEAGIAYKPAMGFGQSAGCARPDFREVGKVTRDRKPGHHCFLSRKPGGVWLVCWDADYAKRFEHERWLTPADRPGAFTIYGEPSEDRHRWSRDEKEHLAYAKHIVAEEEVEEPYRGALRRRWKSKSDNNHWLDASAMSNVAAFLCGIRLFQRETPEINRARRKRVSYL